MRPFSSERRTISALCANPFTGSVQSLPDPAATPELELERAVLDELTAEYPTALGTPRQRARFLCGLSSPPQGFLAGQLQAAD